MNPWSNWSRCSSSCGRGQKISVRRPTNKALNTIEEIKIISDLYNKIQNGREKIRDINELEISTVSDPEHPCYLTTLVQVRPCGSHNYTCEGSAEYICSQLPMRGNCRKDPEYRYYFSVKQNRCGIFKYTGCDDGSKNNFMDYDSCQSFCMSK